MTTCAVPDTSWTVPPKLYRIGEVVQHSGLSRQTVHNYTTMGLIRERERTDGGHRLYGEDVFKALAVIKTLKVTRTLEQIREILQHEGLIDGPGAAGLDAERSD